MAVTQVGFAGDDVRSDVLVTIENADQQIVQIKSTVKAMYGEQLEAQVESTLVQYGNPHVKVTLDDSGALPFMVQARLEAALSRHLGAPLPVLSGSPRVPVRDRPRRSRLYIPGNQPKYFPNAGIYGADCLIFDLEDSVPTSEKDAARSMVRQALASLSFGSSEVMVRINSGEVGFADLDALASVHPEVIVVPKVESAGELATISSHLDHLNSPAFLVAILETALGVMRAGEIAASTPRLIAMTIGVEDYVADLRASDREAAVWANGVVLNTCRALGLSPLASVTSEVHDLALVERQAAKMAFYGFDGAGCLHPSQIEPVHRGFCPTDDELASAEEIVRCYDEARSMGQGVISVNGRMVDEPVYRQALRLLMRGGRA